MDRDPREEIELEFERLHVVVGAVGLIIDMIETGSLSDPAEIAERLREALRSERD